MIAAVGAVAFFALLALEAISAGRGAVAGADGVKTRASLSAAADAGAAIAIHGLGAVDAGQRWSLMGDTHTVAFDGDTLTVGVEDEDGKIPINFIQEPRLRTLFRLAGAPADKIDGLVGDFLLLRDGPLGAKSAGPVSQEGLTAIDELALLKDMTPALYARIAPEVTVNSINLSFDPRTAKPLALAVMSPGAAAASPFHSPGGSDSINQEAVIALAGRAVTLRIEASDGQGASLRRSVIVQFTGAKARPFLIRSVD